MTNNEQILAKFFVDREGEGILSRIHEIDFLAEGILDSLDMVSLAVYIEKALGVKLDLTKPETLAAMRKFDSLAALVQASA